MLLAASLSASFERIEGADRLALLLDCNWGFADVNHHLWSPVKANSH